MTKEIYQWNLSQTSEKYKWKSYNLKIFDMPMNTKLEGIKFLSKIKNLSPHYIRIHTQPERIEKTTIPLENYAVSLEEVLDVTNSSGVSKILGERVNTNKLGDAYEKIISQNKKFSINELVDCEVSLSQEEGDCSQIKLYFNRGKFLKGWMHYCSKRTISMRINDKYDVITALDQYFSEIYEGEKIKGLGKHFPNFFSNSNLPEELKHNFFDIQTNLSGMINCSPFSKNLKK